MYTVSDKYITAIAADEVTETVRGTVSLLNGTIINIGFDDILDGSLSYNEQCVSGNDLDIGSVFASEMAVTLTIPIDNPYSLDGARIAIDYGVETDPGVYEFVPLGHYYVTDIDRQKVGVALKALDGMILLDKDLIGVIGTGTARALVLSICTRCGVTLSTTSLQFESFANHDAVLTVPADGQIQTCRDLLMWICQVTCTFARFDRLGGLELIPVTGRLPVRTIDSDLRFDNPKVSDFYTKITKVEMAIGDTLYSTGTDGMTMSLESNPLLLDMSADEIGVMLADVFALVTTCEYTPVEIDHVGDPSLQPGDFISLTELEGPDIISYITHSNWALRGSHKIKAAGQTGLLKTQYSQAGKAISSIGVDVKKAAENAEQAKQTANNAMISANEKNSIFRQPEPPDITGRKVGDTWFDTDGDNHIYTFDGTGWASAQLGSGAIAEGSIAKEKLEVELKQELEENQQAIARKNSVYRQPTKPVGGTYNIDDMWLDTANGNAIYTYDGTDWISAQLGSSAIADNSITGNKIGHGVIDADNIAQGAITADKIMDGIISETKFNIKTHFLF